MIQFHSKCCNTTSFLVFILALCLAVFQAQGQVVISQIYGGGGNSGAPFKNDFIEIFNKGTGTVYLSGWTVQYASTSGSSWQVTALRDSVLPMHYFLIKEAAGSGGGDTLPTPDAVGTLAMAAANGKVALVMDTAALTGSCPASLLMADLVGYGTAGCFEGAGAAPAGSNTLAVIRHGDGATDTGDNSADFSTGTPVPHNSLAPPLSVEFTSLTLTVEDAGNRHRLDWSTAGEINNMGFYIQRRITSAEEFADLPEAFVAGHGTTLIPQQYTYSCDPPAGGACEYRLRQVNLDGTFRFTASVRNGSASVAEAAQSTGITNLSCYPNPFNAGTQIRFSVDRKTAAVVAVYNTLGQQVDRLFEGMAEPGRTYALSWNAGRFPSGMYFCRLEAGNRIETKTLLLLK